MEILVPIDDSEPARKAVAHAARSYPDADVTLLHIINPQTGMHGDGAMYAYDSLLDSQRQAAVELFDETEEIATEHDCTVTTETIVGFPAREIVSFADEAAVDHIVIGSHGRSGPARVLLGSVAEQVVRRAPVPVTVVR